MHPLNVQADSLGLRFNHGASFDGSQDVEPFLAVVETAAGVKRFNQRHLGKQVAVFPEVMRMSAVISCPWSLRA